MVVNVGQLNRRQNVRAALGEDQAGTIREL